VNEYLVNYWGKPHHVPVTLLHDQRKVVEEIIGTVTKGGCVLWVRNTVGDALDARSTLLETSKMIAENVILFHARFAACDRLRIEDQILSIFGIKGATADRRGKIVIATQVAEQSLDVDFDVLITDLAPIDLVLQRIGRWRRHKRKDRPGGLPDSVYVFSPPLDEEPDAKWFSSRFLGASYVYPFQSQLWLTAKLLAEKSGYIMPDDARRLIEGVYGEGSEEVPEALRQADLKAHGEAMAMMTMAGLNSLNLTQGYGGEFGGWKDEEVSPTRIGEPTVRLRLAKWDGKNLSPWSDETSLGMAWSLSEVAVPAWRVAGGFETDDPDLLKAMNWAIRAMPDRCRWSILIPMKLVDNRDWKAEVMSENRKKTVLKYGMEYGLAYDSGVTKN
jgi:CRISPR-associated endonuclease/helicase Cas3